MKIRVLGGFGSEQSCCHLTGFLLNDCVMLDAGTISSALTIPELLRITHVLLTHAHLDHTNAVPFMADNIVGMNKKPVEIAAIAEVLDTVKEHIMNDKVWPDFTKIPNPKAPTLKYRNLTAGRETPLGGGLRFKPIKVNHTVPTTGFIISEDENAVLYSGDTKATDAIWKAGLRLGDKLKAVFIETSFPNRMQFIADISGHLTPQSLGEELKKLKGYEGPVYVYHVKSQYLLDIEREIDALGRKDVIVVRDGMEWEI
ncbi:MAG: 3',5'-cyclic-nucleotide phosphodiesterase [Nitrospirae bacterium]|nr:3',5'-cyclic-nucleotide phosphodiesterase [Nitrospirota bacterium]MBI5695808.1 3',5'-cyclic-nucleotide phosphodiesterase [Nitrospirota bacterium]